MKNKNLKHWAICCMVGGLLLITAAFLLVCYNMWENEKAGEFSRNVIEELDISDFTKLAYANDERIIPGEYEIPDYILNPEMEMPKEEVDGLTYIGILEIPSRNLILPIVSEWSYSALRKAPCRYTGSVYTDDLTIAGHNYQRHFRCLSELGIGEEIRFTDMDGNLFRYIIVDRVVLQGDQSNELKEGDWDLTLFTCTIGGQYRVTVRCERENDEKENKKE